MVPAATKQTYSESVNNRLEDVIITHLLCMMLITPAILFCFRVINDDECISYQVTDSLEDILFSCVKYVTGCFMLEKYCSE